MTTHILRIDDRARLAQSRAEWIEFSNRCAVAAPFCLPVVWMAWLEAFAQYDPLIYELREGEELQALLPLYKDGSTLHILTAKHLDYQEIAAISDDAAATLLAAVVEEEGGKGFTFTFDKVAEHSRLRIAIDDPRVGELASIKRRFFTICPSANVKLSGPGKFLSTLPGGLRRDCNTAARRAREAFPEHIVEHRLGSEIDRELISEAARLHRENQFRKDGDSIFNEIGYVDFLERQAIADAPILLSVIREHPGGKPMAFNLGYFADNKYFYYLTAYDGNYLALSPGRRLLAETLSHCADRVKDGEFRYDLLSGQETYKLRWATLFYEVDRIQVIPKRIANLPRVAAYSALYGLKEAKNRVLKWRGNSLSGSLQHEPPALSR